MEPYPVGEDGVVRPLKLLREAKPTHVVGAPRRNVITSDHSTYYTRFVSKGFKVAPVYLLGLCRDRVLCGKFLMHWDRRFGV